MKYLRLSILLLSAILLPACSSINLQVAQDLAENGRTASLEISESYGKRSDNLEIYLEGEYILSALKTGYSAPNKTVITRVDSIKFEMQERKEIFANLASVYGSFAQLAIHDSSDDIESSLRGLTSAVNDYSKLTTGKIRFTQVDEDIAAITGKQVYQAYHKYKVKQASRIIRERLEAIKELIAKQSEKDTIVSMEKEIDRNRLKVATALWDEGLGLPNKIIEEHIETYGLEVNKRETMRQIDKTTTGKMQQAIRNVMKFRHDREVARRKDAYNASVNAVQSLITAHLQLENGDKPSLESLGKLLQTIRTYTDSLKSKQEE